MQRDSPCRLLSPVCPGSRFPAPGKESRKEPCLCGSWPRRSAALLQRAGEMLQCGDPGSAPRYPHGAAAQVTRRLVTGLLGQQLDHNPGEDATGRCRTVTTHTPSPDPPVQHPDEPQTHIQQLARAARGNYCYAGRRGKVPKSILCFSLPRLQQHQG